MKKLIFILSLYMFLNANAISLLNGNANFCHKDDIDCKNALQTAADGVNKVGDASLTAVNSVEPSIRPIANSIGGLFWLFGF